MKRKELVAALREEASNWLARGDALPSGEDRVPYAVYDAFSDLADRLEDR